MHQSDLPLFQLFCRMMQIFASVILLFMLTGCLPTSFMTESGREMAKVQANDQTVQTEPLHSPAPQDEVSHQGTDLQGQTVHAIDNKEKLPDKPQPTLVSYNGAIEHIFFHPLIVDPGRAFLGDRLAKGFDDYFVTVPEFKKIIQKLYNNGYILVDIFDAVSLKSDGTVQRKPLILPEGKKPLILSIDDLNYYTYMVERGTALRLQMNDHGEVLAATVDEHGIEALSRDGEIIPILDQFVAAHPDFSLNGAKGIINLTGFEGIFGYRTNDPARPDYEKLMEAARTVAKRLKETGWRFASHSYGHPDVKKISLAQLKEDTRAWKKEVEPLIGPTPIYVYPYGSSITSADAKLAFLKEQGFHLFFGVGPRPYLKMETDWLFMDRRHIDGIALKTQKHLLKPLFDANDIIDPVRPK